MLTISNPIDSNGNTIRGISKLKTWFNENKIDGFEEHISFHRNLQELRSAGTGHRKGKNYDKISKNLIWMKSR